MTFDSAVPVQLKNIQQWFGSIIIRPIDIDSRINPISPSGNPIEDEACDYIAPSPTLRPAQRIELYNQQYWWRLLGIMHDAYPLVTRLFGYQDFNASIAIPYLMKYPSDTWSLNALGDRLPKWIEEDYVGDDKPLVSRAAKIDNAYNYSFVAPQHEGIDLDDGSETIDLSNLLDEPLSLQPYVHLFEIPYDLFQYRSEFLKHEPEFWVENDFPLLAKAPNDENYYFLLYRNRYNNVMVEKIGGSEYEMLKQFECEAGFTINDSCEWLENMPSESSLVMEASQHLHLWIQRWVANQLFKKKDSTQRHRATENT